MKRLLLVGAGHAHAQVLRGWAQAPVPGVEVVVVSPQALAPYSGMVPGWLAGTCRWEDICIDFAALCRAAGARLLGDELHALRPEARHALLASGAALAYDIASLNVGSTLRPPGDLGVPVLAMRPLSALRTAWDTQLAAYAADATPTAFRLMAVGAGAAGFESLLAARARLLALRPDRPVQVALVSRGAELLPGIAPGAVRAARRALARVQADLRLDTDATPAVVAGCDLLLWATGAQAHAWQLDAQRRGGLAVDAQGFVRIDARLRSLSHPEVFAVGDCAGFSPPLPKAGVYAVRQGPVLQAGLRAALGGAAAAAEPPPYTPQRRFLALLATADGRAIASRGRLWAEGRWMWRWKNHIDRAFLAGFRPGPTAADAPAQDLG